MIWTSLIAQGKRRLWMSLLIATLIALVYLHFARFYQGRVASWILVVGWIPVTLNLLRAGLGLAYHLGRHPFHELDLGLESDVAAPGSAFVIELRARLRRRYLLRRLAVELRCHRQTTTERGRQSSVLHSEEKVLERDLRLEVDEPKIYRTSVPVPAGAPFSFRSMEGKIFWMIGVVLEIEGWGELRDELEVTVAPG